MVECYADTVVFKREGLDCSMHHLGVFWVVGHVRLVMLLWSCTAAFDGNYSTRRCLCKYWDTCFAVLEEHLMDDEEEMIESPPWMNPLRRSFKVGRRPHWASWQTQSEHISRLPLLEFISPKVNGFGSQRRCSHHPTKAVCLEVPHWENSIRNGILWLLTQDFCFWMRSWRSQWMRTWPGSLSSSQHLGKV